MFDNYGTFLDQFHFSDFCGYKRKEQVIKINNLDT